MKLPADIAHSIETRDFEQEDRDADAADRARHAAFVATWRNARYATEERARFLRPSQWFVVDGSGWEKGPYRTEDQAEGERVSLDRARLMVLHSAR
jgi:hypothetical protein